MKSKFYGELHQFLVQDRVSLDSGIVSYIVYQLAGIQVTESQQSRGFSFTERWIGKEEKEKITFSVPEKFSLPQLRKLMFFFSLPEEAYHLNEPLLLNSQYIFEHFLPKFKEHFQLLKEQSPAIIARYRVASAPILESTAQNTLSEGVEEAKKIVFSDRVKVPGETMQSLIDLILFLSSRLANIKRFPLFYKAILASSDKIDEFLQLQEIKDNKEISTTLNMLLNGIKLYALYHRNESVLSNIKFHKELKEFLIPYRVTVTKCDLLEHVVLALAEATMLSESPCRFIEGEDPARLTITFGDTDAVNVKIITDYMRRLGDETACEGYGEKRHGSVLREEREECTYEEVDLLHSALSIVRPAKRHESHTIEVDGEFFYSKIFPKIKEKIEEMAVQGLLTKYQELSNEYFKLKEVAKVSEVSMFSRPSPAADGVVQEPGAVLAL